MSVDQVPDTRPSRRRSGRPLRLLRDLVLIVVAALVISFVIKTFFVRSFYIPSESMSHTLEVQDRVVVSLLTPGLVPLKRGDIVVFTDPGGWLDTEPAATQPVTPFTAVLTFLGLAPDGNNHLIKRVIGLPGDKVVCCTASGTLSVNGHPIHEPYITLTSGGARADPYPFSVTVPKGDLWVLGDNRDDSRDSAYHHAVRDTGPFVPIADVTGRAMLVSWPVSRWKILGD